jgi:hypothetical protein
VDGIGDGCHRAGRDLLQEVDLLSGKASLGGLVGVISQGVGEGEELPPDDEIEGQGIDQGVDIVKWSGFDLEAPGFEGVVKALDTPAQGIEPQDLRHHLWGIQTVDRQ